MEVQREGHFHQRAVRLSLMAGVLGRFGVRQLRLGEHCLRSVAWRQPFLAILVVLEMTVVYHSSVRVQTDPLARDSCVGDRHTRGEE
jgi:hypothetical protein